MASNLGFQALVDALGPDDLRMAANAYDAALRSLDEDNCPQNPHTARLLIGRYIIERALAGERDPVKLAEGALSCLDLMGTTGLTALARSAQSG